PGPIEVRPADEAHLFMRVRLPAHEGLIQLVERVRRLFDLAADPMPVTSHLRRSADLGRLVAALPGLRVPGAWDGFELAVRAILGQQVTVKGGTTLAGRLVERFGRRIESEIAGLTHLFPRADALAEADLGVIGIPRVRADTIRALAASVVGGAVVLDAAHGLDDALARLRAIPGIGDWTAHYIARRALGEPDAFPATDLGLRRALGNGHGPVSAGALARAAERWRPWRAYATMYLWTAGR